MDQVNQQVRFISIKTSKTFLIVPSATTRAYSSNESIIVFIVRVVIVLATTEEPVNVAHRIRLCDVMVSGECICHLGSSYTSTTVRYVLYMLERRLIKFRWQVSERPVHPKEH